MSQSDKVVPAAADSPREHVVSYANTLLVPDRPSLADAADAAAAVGYPYFSWDGQVHRTDDRRPLFDEGRLAAGPVVVTVSYASPAGGVFHVDPQPNRLWAVCAMAWQYDDNNYYRPEEDPGWPRGIFASRAEAETACVIRNLASFRLGLDIHDRFHDGVDGEWGAVFTVPRHLLHDRLLELGADVSGMPPDPADVDDRDALQNWLRDAADWVRKCLANLRPHPDYSWRTDGPPNPDVWPDPVARELVAAINPQWLDYEVTEVPYGDVN